MLDNIEIFPMPESIETIFIIQESILHKATMHVHGHWSLACGWGCLIRRMGAVENGKISLYPSVNSKCLTQNFMVAKLYQL